MGEQIGNLVNRMEETRQSLAVKIDSLERRVGDTVSQVSENVAEAANAVQSSIQSVGNVMNISDRIKSAPWISLGSSLAIGIVAGLITRRPDPYARLSGEFTRSVERLVPLLRSNAHSFLSELSNTADKAVESTKKAVGNVQKEANHISSSMTSNISHLLGVDSNTVKAMAIGATLGLVREMVVPNLPRTMQSNARRGVDAYTRAVGGQPYARKVKDVLSS